MGGIPWKINDCPLADKPIMIIGMAWVKKNKSTLFTLAWSYNNTFTKYYST